MKKIMMAASLVVLLGGMAIAQPATKGSPSGGATSGTLPQAPVGHRQPRAGDVPSEKTLDPNNPVNKEDALLDKKIKSICRGC
ncbi:hypothetical protein [Bradyrhizobium guangdongense]|uniref:Uncharacterized protein n=1 Tax=Bradyrhizobium guangdongense TaxID=1325090 RepID=A0A410V731_9BRAD|nr:hypothetical protein [Bradyrhizobium guangdongense]QAU39430.1 hypothetical protein X265_18500 [Bradyrhizobium guangdongense]QOZ63839.1 hypothetical protein XH86_18505 [Bradyrhizobium guangdongense]GGI23757.1 hypothetical protein GCM10010987_25980 [Bradyrhizobium guangdongense]